MRRGAKKGEHVVTGRSVDEFSRHRAVFVSFESAAFNELVSYSACTNGVFQIEFILPSRAQNQNIFILFHQPIANRVQIIQRPDDNSILFTRNVDGFGSIGRG